MPVWVSAVQIWVLVVGPLTQPSQGSEGKSGLKHERPIMLSSSCSLRYLLFDFVACLFVFALG